MKHITIIALVPLVLLLGIIPALQTDFIQSADASTINSKKVCGDQLCSELVETTETPSTPTEAEIPHDAQFMFVQTAESGELFKTLTGYTLTLDNIAPQIVYFSDRPYNIYGHLTTSQWIDGIWTNKQVDFENNPPNASLVLFDGNGNTHEMIVQLNHVKYDAHDNTMQYEITLSSDYYEKLVSKSGHTQGALPVKFGNTSLFIDDVVGSVVDKVKKGTNKVVHGADKVVDDVKNLNKHTVAAYAESAEKGIKEFGKQLGHDFKKDGKFYEKSGMTVGKYIAKNNHVALSWELKTGEVIIVDGKDMAKWTKMTATQIYDELSFNIFAIGEFVKPKLVSYVEGKHNLGKECEKETGLILDYAIAEGVKKGKEQGGSFAKDMGIGIGAMLGTSAVVPIDELICTELIPPTPPSGNEALMGGGGEQPNDNSQQVMSVIQRQLSENSDYKHSSPMAKIAEQVGGDLGVVLSETVTQFIKSQTEDASSTTTPE